MNDKGIVFLTGAAGYLLDLIYGFAGIRISEDGIEVKPLLPEEISRIVFKKILYRGKAYRLIVEKENGIETYDLKEINKQHLDSKVIIRISP